MTGDPLHDFFAETELQSPSAPLDSERAALATMILHGAALAEGKRLLTPGDFYSNANAEIFTTLCLIADENLPCDMIVLRDRLELNGTLGTVGGREYLDDLLTLEGVPQVLPSYVKAIRAAARNRRIRRAMLAFAKVSDEVNLGHLRDAIAEPARLDPSEAPVSEVDFTKELDLDSLYQWLPMLGVDGYVAPGLTWLISSLPKVGKSTLLWHLALDWTRAGKRILILSEEPEDIIQQRTRSLGLDPKVFRVYTGREAPWSKTLAWLPAQDFDVLMLDSVRYWLRLPPGGEYDGTQVTAIVSPLQAVTREKKAPLILSHHLRKSGGEEGTRHSGSTAWVGTVDVATELTRDPHSPRRRVLRSVGRADSTTPQELLIEISDDEQGYHSLGNPDVVTLANVIWRLKNLFDLGPMRQDALQEALGPPKPSIGNVVKAYRQLEKEGVIRRTGAGGKADPYIWELSEAPE
ncbi:MAG TPA: DnaB-like helicase N-terminal domain-containing protein [Anaerolineae bacterium]|nr:DnaB-like helicase N-terminal domain-containing protein [Anaerolineae bacterium]